MLKPLLRTLAALSGNVKLACTLTDYKKTATDEYECLVRYARLLPLSSHLHQYKIEANLLYSTYDYDLQKFFKHYSSYFFDDCFEFDKNNYIEIDRAASQKNRNTDFEFGCKRVSFIKNDSQYAFYAPVYMESLADIPDYFMITATFKNEKYTITRNIKVNVSTSIKTNYLYIYLKNYLSKLDSNVIFCNPMNKQGTYYGIDLIKGGFTKVLDNSIAKAYKLQNTINNLDAVISKGFKSNQIAIRQIIPFAWYFNINDILTPDEQKKFKNSRVYISGAWYKNGSQCKFYNIDTNYQYYYERPYMLNIRNGIFAYQDTGNNLMNMNYPSLNEAKYIGYRYTNKLNIRYNRWKLKYSEDEHPYITNLSPAFSLNQNSIYKYGGFPDRYSSIDLITDIKNNVIIPVGHALTAADSPYVTNSILVNNYINTLNNNVSTWYTLLNDTSDLYSQDIWKDTEDNKVYYRGILYDLSAIYNEYTTLVDDIDKFAVIVNLHFNKLREQDLKKLVKADISLFTSPKHMTDKTAWLSERVHEGFERGSSHFSSLPMFYNTTSTFGQGNAQIVFDKLYEKAPDGNGDFIDMISMGYNIYDVNCYYKLSDIVECFNNDEYFNDNIYPILTNNQYFGGSFIKGYELLPISYLENLMHENGRDIVFEGKDDARWILKKLYFSQHGNYFKSGYDRDTVVDLIKEYGDKNKEVPVYIEDRFISKGRFKEMMIDIYGNGYTRYNNIIEKFAKYEYCPRVKDETSAAYASDAFVRKDPVLGDYYGNVIPRDKTDNDVLYVDTYNLLAVVTNYFDRFPDKSFSINFENKETRYAKFLNNKHLLYYVSELHKRYDESGDATSLATSLYIKKRVLVGDSNTNNVSLKDYYIPVLNLYDSYRPMTLEEKLAIIDNKTNETTKLLPDVGDVLNIYKCENSKYYSSASYKAVVTAVASESWWICNAYHSRHKHMEDCAKPEEGGEWKGGYDISEYHEEEFYYLPDLFVMGVRGSTNYTPIDEYFRQNISLSDNFIVPYINKKVIELFLSTDADDIDIKDIEFGMGIHESFMPLGFDEINLSNINATELISELKSEITRINELIKSNVYYKLYSSENYRIFNDYTGVHDYIPIGDDEEGKNIKVAILKGELNLKTYIINEEGEFVEHGYDEDIYYVKRHLNDADYGDYALNVISQFLTDIEYHGDNNYYTMTDDYNIRHDLDDLVNIPGWDTNLQSKFTFEVVYKHDFMKLNKNLFDMINLTSDDTPYKDLYLYRAYKPNEYPASLRVYYTPQITTDLSIDVNDVSSCLFPLFDDVLLQEKKYSVIYSEYSQANIYEVSNLATNDKNYRYNMSDVVYMYDVSGDPEGLEYVTPSGKYYTYSYWHRLEKAGSPLINTHQILPSYKLVDSCYSNITKVSDDLGIYDKFNLNTYVYKTTENYTYTYIENTIQVKDDNGKSHTVIGGVERTGYGVRENLTTYAFIMLDAYIDNTNVSFSIVDSKYKTKKYFTYVNEHYIYDGNYNIMDSFNLLLPFSKLNLVDDLFSFDKIIVHQDKYSFNTYYKQNPVYDEVGTAYAYTINKRNDHIDNLTLQRYFDAIVPYIPESTSLQSTYCLKYKNYKHSTPKINYRNDVFYSEEVNMYNYNKLRVYDSDGNYTMFEPTEYKHLNDNKLINLQEKFSISERGTFVYDEILALEQEPVVINKFREYILKDKLNTYTDDEILFLYNRYKVEYDAECVGLNPSKTEKIYTLTYKFTLQ